MIKWILSTIRTYKYNILYKINIHLKKGINWMNRITKFLYSLIEYLLNNFVNISFYIKI